MTNKNDNPQLTRGQQEFQEIIEITKGLLRGVEKIAEAQTDYDEGLNILAEYQNIDPASLETQARDFINRMRMKYPILKWLKILEGLNINNITHFSSAPLQIKTTRNELDETLSDIYPAAAIMFCGEEVVKKAIKEHFIQQSQSD
ncbi:MAG: hypothetical protein Q4G02_01725 [bacterium]|nr:hypothetical protein [bacterium]